MAVATAVSQALMLSSASFCPLPGRSSSRSSMGNESIHRRRASRYELLVPRALRCHQPALAHKPSHQQRHAQNFLVFFLHLCFRPASFRGVSAEPGSGLFSSVLLYKSVHFAQLRNPVISFMLFGVISICLTTMSTSTLFNGCLTATSFLGGFAFR